MPADIVAIIGAGSIGTAWAIAFADAGLAVKLYDVERSRLEAAKATVTERLSELTQHGLSRDGGSLRLSLHSDLAQALSTATHVQECAPEDVSLKRQLFAELDRLAPTDAVLASSSSFLPASSFASDLAGCARVLVLHPGNPPYLLRVAEVVPAPFTSEATVTRTIDLLKRAGIEPVRLTREIDGFVFNRLQGALLREAYALVRDGIVTPGEIDRIVRDGLGLRWSLLGPFETVHLNTRGGLRQHARRMGPAYWRMRRERGENEEWSDALVNTVARDVEGRRPLADWEEHTAGRDRALMALLEQRSHDTRLRALLDAPVAGDSP